MENDRDNTNSFYFPAPVSLWIPLFLLTILTAFAASIVHPSTFLEKQIPYWPPSQPMGEYLQRVLIHPLFRWDADHFANITARGYTVKDGALAFFPLYPWSARVLVLLGFDPYLSLVLVGALASLGFILVFERLARQDLSPQLARCAVDLLLVFPASLLLFIPYSEPLFVLLMTMTLYLARQKRWLAAIASAALATLAKQPGIFLVLPLAMELLSVAPADRRRGPRQAGIWLALLLIPAAMMGWLVFRTIRIERTVPDTGSLQNFALTLLMSSNAQHIVVSRPFAWPWQIIAEAVRAASEHQYLQLHILFNLGGYFLTILLLILTWRHLRPSYRWLALGLIVFSMLDFSFNRTAIPIPSLFRHAYLAFPAFIGLPLSLHNKWMRAIYVFFSLLLFILLVYFYGLNSWVI